MSDNDSAVSKLTYLLIGGGIGAIVALLFAPKAGRELRGEIADVTRRGVDYTREQGRLIGDQAGQYYERGRERANELVEVSRDRAAQAIEQGRSTVVNKRDAVSAAIEAGKQAYTETKRKGRAATDEPTEGEV